MAFVQANADTLAAQDLVAEARIEEVCTKLGAEVEKLTTSQAGAYAELRELLASSGGELTRLVDGKIKNIESEFLR